MTFAITSDYLDRQRAFSIVTFGAGERTEGVLNHIRNELVEVAAEPDDITEWADLVILAFDGALRRGFNSQDLLDAVEAKQVVNEAREWPDFRLFREDQPIEHVRDCE